MTGREFVCRLARKCARGEIKYDVKKNVTRELRRVKAERIRSLLLLFIAARYAEKHEPSPSFLVAPAIVSEAAECLSFRDACHCVFT